MTAADITSRYPRLLGLVLDTPLVIYPPKLRTILAALSGQIGLEIEQVEAAGEPVKLEALTEVRERRALRVDAHGIAQIDLHGAMVQRTRGVDAVSGLTSYEGVGSELAQAADDPQVRGVLLTVDSPGGTVHGVFDLADQIHAMRGRKPVWAVASDWAASGAYALASAAERLIVTQTAMVGSIGVIGKHVDRSSMEEKAGLKVTEIFAGARKVDGSPHRPLSDEAHREMQAHCDRVYGLFLDAVARNRGLSRETVAKTEAAIFIGADAVAAGLADEVNTLSGAAAALAKHIRSKGALTMSAATTATLASAADQVTTEVRPAADRSAELEAEVARLKAQNAAQDEQLKHARGQRVEAILAEHRARIAPASMPHLRAFAEKCGTDLKPFEDLVKSFAVVTRPEPEAQASAAGAEASAVDTEVSATDREVFRAMQLSGALPPSAKIEDFAKYQSATTIQWRELH